MLQRPGTREGLAGLAFAVLAIAAQTPSLAATALMADDMVTITAGAFTMGRNDGPDDERPSYAVVLSAFQITNLYKNKYL